MKKGFVTIATGKEQYYKLAKNLLLSYRMFASEKLPFAIIAEEENEYTALFDDVVITNEATHSFMDKFLLMKCCPYDENIFIDADSLIFGDLNEYWEIFENSTDFSASGVNVPREQKENVWYNVEDVWKYGEKLDYKVRVHTGVCFIRKSDKLAKLYEDCIDIWKNYDKLYFHSYPNSVDECVLGVAMPLNGMKAERLKPNMCAAYPCLTYLKADILKGRLEYKTPWGINSNKGIHLHFGTIQTYQALYRFNAECLQYMLDYKDQTPPFYKRVLYKHKLRLCFLYIVQYKNSLKAFIKRLFKKICKRS